MKDIYSLAEQFDNLDEFYERQIKKNIFNLPKNKIEQHINDIIELIEKYEAIIGDVYEVKDELHGDKQTHAYELYENINIFIRHLNPKLSKAQNLLNQMNFNSSRRRDRYILILSIVISTIISIFTPVFHNIIGLNQNKALEIKLDEIKHILTEDVKTNKTNEIKFDEIKNIITQNLETNKSIDLKVDSLILIIDRFGSEIDSIRSE